MKVLGARYLGSKKCEFKVWAPLLQQLNLLLTALQREIPMQRSTDGYFSVTVNDILPGTKYFYKIEDRLVADPASYYQPEGVKGHSCVVDHTSFSWDKGQWPAVALKDLIIYELHIGTFTPEGTFGAAEARLDDLIDLGITAIEIMPVAQFPGTRNWGYDGVFPYAVQNSYGGPEGLKKLINTCHRKGLAIILDVVYNHIGPEGNVLPQYMPLFTDKYHTPWGEAINFDDAYSYGVREYFIQNAIYWMEHYHIDALRLDAIHGIFDMSANHLLKEMAQAVENFSFQHKRRFYLIAESDLNDRRIVLTSQQEGYGIDSQWSDDFHHAIHTTLTKESKGYYEDFGSIDDIATAMKEGFVYSGKFSKYRKRHHGNKSDDITSEKFVVCIQNHDQVGNRFKADRLRSLISFEAAKLAAGALLTASYIPLIFMGEEYGEKSPFNYFVSFDDEELVEAVREGRRKEFSAFIGTGEIPDPFSQDTFTQSVLNWKERQQGEGKVLLSFYKKLIELRKEIPALANFNREGMILEVKENVIIVKRYWTDSSVNIFMNFNALTAQVTNDFDTAEKILDTADVQWQGQGDLLPQRITPGQILNINPWGFAIYKRT